MLEIASEPAPSNLALPAARAAGVSILIAADTRQANFRLKSLINKADWLRLIPVEVSPEELLTRKIDANIVLLSADKLPFTLLEALSKRFCVLCCVDHAVRNAIFGWL